MKNLDAPSIDFASLTSNERYHLMIEHIIPRPIAWVSTQNLQGQGNLAPFSFFTGVSSQPPCLVISITPKRDGTLKDTLKNILETQHFTVNGCDEALTAQIHQTSAEYEYGQNELNAVGLTPEKTQSYSGFRVKEAPWAMECRLLQTVDVGDRGSPGSAVLVIGEVLMLHRSKNQWNPLSRLGGAAYGRTEKGPELARPQRP
jgi:flavin reductase (DIM6/NTAB) family NADH-FMN oxidoreductase RutF